ncbi:MAG TPA: AsmA-like C-terminal region-containing protein [Xanthobacteraceae bacterium]|nr:AsmA-like C-terminal region-containing protein [Xanthobacteraceae bacterium]
MPRWRDALRGYARATFARVRAAFDTVRTTAHSADTHERLHHLLAGRRGRLIKIAFGLGVAACLAVIAVSALWLRLASGPLSLDMLTPWLTAAIEERLGGHHRVEVGGTQIERTEQGRMAVRLRDILVRDERGAIVAVAPKAEVGVSVANLLLGRIRPQRLSLIGAGMAVRIEPDGQVTVFAGGDQRVVAEPLRAPPAPGGAISAPPPAQAPAGPQPAAAASGGLASMLGWLDRLDALGLDGQGLTEIGLKSGSISVDDRRSGKHWEFVNIDLSLTRPESGSVALALASTGADGPWSLAATVTPKPDGQRLIEAVVRDVSPKDLLLALRLDSNQIEADTPISATVRAQVGADAAPLTLEGQIIIGAGLLVDPHEPLSRLRIDEAQVNLRWDAARRLLLMPIEISSGENRVSLLGQLEPPRTRGAPWAVAITGGRIELAALDGKREQPLVLDRVAMRGRIDPAGHRVEIERAEMSGGSVGVNFAGALDASGTEPRLTGSFTGTPMPATALKQIWPPFVVDKIRTWVVKHVLAGTVDRMVMSVNAPVNTLRPDGPPVPDDGLSVEITGSGVALQPFEALQPVRDADLSVRVVGRAASVKVGHGSYLLAGSGRKLALSNGVFEVSDMQPKRPYSRTRFRVDGSVDAAAELVSSGPLRSGATIQVDPATSRGSFVAQVSLGMPVGLELPELQGKIAYAVEADVTNLAIDRLVRGQNLEANAVHVSANPQGVQLKGDVRIAGAPLSIDYKKPIGDADAEVRLQTTLDEAARARFSADLSAMLGGPVPVKLNGRIGSGDRESRFTVDCDLVQAKISDLLPGWVKSPGKPTRATFTFVDKGRTFRLEDLVINGPGTLVKGTVEMDTDGEIVLANFPSFALSDGDKASMKAERAPDGTMKVTMRGDVYDGHGFIKTAMSGPSDPNAKASARDLDLDLKVGALVGFNGEVLRNVELRLSRRGGQIRTFSLNARVGRDSTLLGDLRAYNSGRQVVFFQTNDAGALFRLTDTYPRIVGGQMWIAMDAPTPEQAPQEGHLSVSNFTVRGEPALERIAGGAAPNDPGPRPQAGGSGVDFTEMRVNFVKAPGRLAIRDGVVRGNAVGATLEGHIDFARDDVRMHGTFVPAYGINNMFARPPVLGFILGGGEREGLFGITYEVVGSPHAPTLRVNPMSALMPGFTRKIFEGPMSSEGFSPPQPVEAR